VPSAYVFINLKYGSTGSVISDLKNVKGVEEVYSLYGVYDILTRIEGESIDAIKEEIENIRKHRKRWLGRSDPISDVN